MFRWLNNFLHETVYSDTNEVCKEEYEKTRKNSAYYNTNRRGNTDLYICIFLLLCVFGVAIYLGGTEKRESLSFGAITMPVTNDFKVRAQGTGRIKNLYVEDTQFVAKGDKIVDIEYEPRTGRELYLDEILYAKKAHHTVDVWKKHLVSIKADVDGFIYNSKMHSGLPVEDSQELYELVEITTPICVEVVVTKDELNELSLGESVTVVLDFLENPEQHKVKGTVKSVFDESIRHGGNLDKKMSPLNDEPYKFVYVSLDKYKQKVKDNKKNVSKEEENIKIPPGKLVTVRKEYPAKRRIVLLEEYFNKLWNDFLTIWNNKS